jgi:hypothetical protein
MNDLIVKRDASINDVLQVMVAMILQEKNSDTVKSIAKELAGYPTRTQLATLGNFIARQCPFMPDNPTEQKIKSVRRLLESGEGNCVQYTVAFAAIGLALGYRVAVVVAKYPGNSQWQHVYPIIDDMAVDIVPSQKQDGSERYSAGRWNKWIGLNHLAPGMIHQKIWIS